jgi:hypothetical protein
MPVNHNHQPNPGTGAETTNPSRVPNHQPKPRTGPETINPSRVQNHQPKPGTGAETTNPSGSETTNPRRARGRNHQSKPGPKPPTHAGRGGRNHQSKPGPKPPSQADHGADVLMYSLFERPVRSFYTTSSKRLVLQWTAICNVLKAGTFPFRPAFDKAGSGSPTTSMCAITGRSTARNSLYLNRV